MYPLANNKQGALLQLKRFKALYPHFPDGDIEATEKPDFLVQTSKNLLGIEVTDLYLENLSEQPPLQAKEALRGRIVEMTKRKYDVHNHQFLNVSIHFDSHYMLKITELDPLSEQLATLLVKNVPAPGETYIEEYNSVNRGYFPKGIHTVRATNLPSMQKSYFSSPSAGFIPRLKQHDLERAISPKESKVKKYREKAQEVWLLINCDCGQLSTTFDFNEEALQFSHESNFDKIFLLRYFAQTVHQIK